MSVKEILFPKVYYDPTKDKIFGCKKGTKDWYHERAHQVLAQKMISPWLDYWAYFVNFLTLLFLIFQTYRLAIISFSVLFTLSAFEEFAAVYLGNKWWKEAKNHKKNIKPIP